MIIKELNVDFDNCQIQYLANVCFYACLLIHVPHQAGATGGIPGPFPQVTACAPQTKIVPPQARTVPQRN